MHQADYLQKQYRSYYVAKNHPAETCFGPLTSIYMDKKGQTWSCNQKQYQINWIDLTNNRQRLNQSLLKNNFSTCRDCQKNQSCHLSYKKYAHLLESNNNNYLLKSIELEMSEYVTSFIPSIDSSDIEDVIIHLDAQQPIERWLQFIDVIFQNFAAHSKKELILTVSNLPANRLAEFQSKSSRFMWFKHIQTYHLTAGEKINVESLTCLPNSTAHYNLHVDINHMTLTDNLKFFSKQTHFSLFFISPKIISEQTLDMLKTYFVNQFDSWSTSTIKNLVISLKENQALAQSVSLKKFILTLQMALQSKEQKTKSLCTLPFTQISIYPDGSIKPCCWLLDYAYNKKNDGQLKKSWNSEKAQLLRKQFTTGPLTICKSKMDKTSCHTRNQIPSEFVDFADYIERPPQKLHWYFSGRCNLQCQTCHNWHFENEFEESDVYWENLKKEIFPYLCELELVGGEPFYQKRTYQLIRTMSELNPSCNWYITTNGQFPFQGKIKDHLDLINIAFFSVSIDSLIPERFASIRKNGDLLKTLRFLDDVIAYKNSLPLEKQFRIMVNFVLQKDNWRELESFISFCRSKGVDPHVIPMVDPEHHSVYKLPETNIRILQQSVQALVIKDHDPYLKFLLSDLDRHLHQCDESANVTSFIDFKSKTENPSEL